MFFQPQLNAFYVDGDREFHHWHAGSESVATVSQLYCAILNGCEANTEVGYEQIIFTGARTTALYTFTLRKGDDTFKMPVQENPALMRFLRTEPFKVFYLTEEPQQSVRVGA
ncbi:MAG: hypothetical protein AAF125_20770 [Chloroflexota bacterium]